jgi:hypothetical protein
MPCLDRDVIRPLPCGRMMACTAHPARDWVLARAVVVVSVATPGLGQARGPAPTGGDDATGPNGPYGPKTGHSPLRRGVNNSLTRRGSITTVIPSFLWLL